MDSLYPIQNAAKILNDPDHVRWSLSSMAEYLNQGIREILRVRPDANAKVMLVQLTAGTRQTLPAKAQSLISIDRALPSGVSVRRVSEHALDAILPMWSAAPAASEIRDYIFDPRKPREYLVYPPAIDGSAVEMTACERIAPIEEPAGADPWPAFPLPQEYADIAMEWILYRCYMNPTGGGDKMKAQNHYQHFYSSLGATGAGRIETGPEGGA